MGYARPRQDNKEQLTWEDLELRDLEGGELTVRDAWGETHRWLPESEWVMAICFDGMGTGLYVLTEDEDSYFTCHSIDLEFAEEIPNDND